MLAIGGAIVFTGIAGSLISRERLDAEATSNSDILQLAKLSLLGYAASVTNGAGGNRLGNLPTPDILNTAGTGILYDGRIDSSNKCLGNSAGGLPGVAGGNSNKRCLGKFPIKSLPLALGITDAHDPTGKVPWLAISANLDFWDSCLNILNSEVLNFVYTAVNCAAITTTVSTTLPYPWLTVYDKDGAILSQRVAAVLIMPGMAIDTETRSQARSPSAPGQPADYLDAIRVPLGCSGGCVRTFDNAGLANEFIVVPAGTLYPADAEDVAKRGQPVKFNDVVIYITIDELMAFLEKRVLKEMAGAVNELSSPVKKNIGFPWAAPYSTAPDSYSKFASAPGNVTGLFPFFVNPAVGPEIPYPTYQTDLNWTVAGLSNPTTKMCLQVQSSPSNLWINASQRITAAFASPGASPLATTSCTWRGSNALACTGTVTSISASQSFQQFTTSARCIAGTPVASTANYTRTRTVTLATDATCSGTLTNSYTAASDTQPQHWSWNCTSVQGGTLFTVNISEAFTTPIPVSGSFLFNGTGRSVTVTNMRYQPLMPFWFYQNEWYKTAFYALSPANRPTPFVAHNCGAATTLNVGGISLDNGLVILAGSQLPNAPATPTQTRPTSNIMDYMEPTSSTDFANCIFKAIGLPITSSYNDRLLPV